MKLDDPRIPQLSQEILAADRRRERAEDFWMAVMFLIGCTPYILIIYVIWHFIAKYW